ncbi:MAG: hypothetical protein IJR49_06685 [Treponema sp.]|nr:hypothetical protein [Treponema sp.]
MLELTQDGTELLNIYTGGKKQDAHRLYATVSKAGLLNSVSSESDALRENEVVTKQGCARFLWNLFCKITGANPVKYSTRYKNRLNAKSPVKDVNLNSSDFDAVLGVVENEFMSLTDGLNFKPSENVSGQDFYTSVKKIK